MSVLNLEPFLFWLADFLLVLERDMGLSVMNAVTDIYFIGKDLFDLRRSPLITLAFGLILLTVSNNTPVICKTWFQKASKIDRLVREILPTYLSHIALL